MSIIYEQKHNYVFQDGEKKIMEKSFVALIQNELLKEVQIKSKHPFEPVVVSNIPKGWKCLGKGNYAAVFAHKGIEEWVVKVYGRNVEEIDIESEVYKRLGNHPAYSQMLYKGENFLVLKRLKSITLYDAVHKGIRIPKSVIQDINEALDYARSKGLTPSDVHGKNVMMDNGKGFVVDVSDFLKGKEDTKWVDLEKAYFKFYLKTLYKYPIPVPYFVLDMVRRSYRKFKKIKRKL